MQKEIILQRQFLEMLKNDAKTFSSIRMQFLDVHHLKLQDVVFENCDLNFCTFSDCEFCNVSLRNCKMYFGSFYTGTANSLVFEKCEIDMTLFNNIQFSRSKFHNCILRWSAIFNSNPPDMSTSTRIKTFTDISQVTQRDIEEAVSMVMKDIERLDIVTRNKIKEMMTKDIDRYNLSHPEEKKGEYGKSSKGYGDSPLTYGEVRQVVEQFFYGGQQGPYKTKRAYETESKYRR